MGNYHSIFFHDALPTDPIGGIDALNKWCTSVFGPPGNRWECRRFASKGDLPPVTMVTFANIKDRELFEIKFSDIAYKFYNRLSQIDSKIRFEF